MPVFLLLLAGLIATFNERASQQLTAWIQNPPSWSPFSAVEQPSPRLVELLLAALLAIPALILSRFIDANKFSLHAMYRVRLIRAFLGASNSRRKPHPFTGFDPNDNVRMADLPARPLHVVNATLNLVKGENLAWQQRKAESFTPRNTAPGAAGWDTRNRGCTATGFRSAAPSPFPARPPTPIWATLPLRS